MASAELSVPNTGAAVSGVSVLRRLLAVPRLHTRDAALILFMAVAVAARFWIGTDPDYWWHLKTGEGIVQTFSIPMRDPFSFTAAGERWIDHEWLSQVLIYGLSQSVGYGGSVLIFGLIGAASIFVMNRLLRQLDVPEPITLALTAAGIALTYGFWAVRPNALTLLLVAIFLSSAFRFVRGHSHTLWLLPILMVLWVNMHAAYVLGLGIVALVLLVQAWRWKQGEGARLGHIALVAILTFLAAGINPYTYHLWIYPFTYFLGDNASLEFISEWQSPNFFHGLGNYPLGIAVLGLLALSTLSKKPDLWRTSVAIAFTALVMQSIRHQSLFGLAMMPVFGELVLTSWPALPAMQRRTEGKRLGMASTLLVALFFAGSLIAVLGWSQQWRSQPSTDAGHAYFPAAGASFVRDNFPQARMLNDYDYGGFLIYALDGYPAVAIDGRADVYGRRRVEVYRTMAELRPGWRTLLDRNRIDMVFFPTASPLAQALLSDEGWKEAFRGKQESVFVRAVPTTSP